MNVWSWRMISHIELQNFEFRLHYLYKEAPVQPDGQEYMLCDQSKHISSCRFILSFLPPE